MSHKDFFHLNILTDLSLNIEIDPNEFKKINGTKGVGSVLIILDIIYGLVFSNLKETI